MNLFKHSSLLFLIVASFSQAYVSSTMAQNWDANVYEQGKLSEPEKLFIDAVRFNSEQLVSEALNDASIQLSKAAINYGVEEASRLDNGRALLAFIKKYPKGPDFYDGNIQEAVKYAVVNGNDTAAQWLVGSPLKNSIDYSGILFAVASPSTPLSSKTVQLSKQIVKENG